MQLSPTALQDFFDAWQATPPLTTEGNLSSRLADFFKAFSVLEPLSAPATPEISIDVSRIERFFAELNQHQATLSARTLAFDPWQVIGLRRDEVRTVRVLAWLLDPHGSHGLGSAILEQGLLPLLNPGITNTALGKYFSIRTESNPNGDKSFRMDMEIESETLYIVVEAKIDALEQSLQIERYCSHAKEYAGQRSWAVVFLTPDGKIPDSAGGYHQSPHVVCLPWHRLKIALQKQVTKHQVSRVNHTLHMRNQADFFVQAYLHHIGQL